MKLGSWQIDLIFGKWPAALSLATFASLPRANSGIVKIISWKFSLSPTLPPNEIITASERLALIRSEIDIRHSDAKHRQTQRLARWAIAFGMVSMAAAITSGVGQFFAHKPTHETLIATIGEPIVATPNARELLTPTQELKAASPAAMLELSAASPTAMLEGSAAPWTLTPELTPAPTPRGTPADIKPEDDKGDDSSAKATAGPKIHAN